MDLAAGELPDKPGVHGSEAELARLGLLAGAGHVVQDPADLGAGEVGVDDEAGLLADEIGLVTQGVAEFGGAAVLPDDGVVHGLAGLGVQTMVVSRWLVMPIPAMFRPLMPILVMASAMTAASEDQISIGLCSTQPGFGKYWVNSICAVEQMFPSWSKTIAREELVP